MISFMTYNIFCIYASVIMKLTPGLRTNEIQSARMSESKKERMNPHAHWWIKVTWHGSSNEHTDPLETHSHILKPHVSPIIIIKSISLLRHVWTRKAHIIVVVIVLAFFFSVRGCSDQFWHLAPSLSIYILVFPVSVRFQAWGNRCGVR